MPLADQALLRLATLRGLLDFLLAIVRFVVLLLLGCVLYVVVMGLLGGSLGCCLVGWLGAVAVSVYRVVAGAWRGGREGCLCGPEGQRRGEAPAAEQVRTHRTRCFGVCSVAISHGASLPMHLQQYCRTFACAVPCC